MMYGNGQVTVDYGKGRHKYTYFFPAEQSRSLNLDQIEDLAAIERLCLKHAIDIVITPGDISLEYE